MNLFRREKPKTQTESIAPTTQVTPTVSLEEIDWEKDKSDILKIETAAFPANMRSDEWDLSRQIGKGFGLLAKRAGCRNPIGYVIAMPLEKAGYQGCSTDRNDRKTAYVESLAVMPTERRALLKLARSLFDKLEQEGYERVTAHVETDGSLYEGLLSLGGIELSRHDNWQGWGKNFTYVEMALN